MVDKNISQAIEELPVFKECAEKVTPYYKNSKNDFIVHLPQQLNENVPIVINYDKFTLGLSVKNIKQDIPSNVKQPISKTENLAKMESCLSVTHNENEKAEIKNNFLSAAHNIRSTVSYDGIQKNVDLDYYVYGRSLKEDIILNAIPDIAEFTFGFTFSGLCPVLNEDNSVTFKDSNGTPVFYIASPFMSDYGDGYSNDIAVVLTPTQNGCEYKLIPNRDWLESPERVYPVVIDPSVQTTQNTNYIHDNGVQQSNPSTVYTALDRIYVGSGPNSTAGRMYFKLTKWPSSTKLTAASITSAKLNLNYYPQSDWQTGNNIKINVYKLSSAWNTNTICWNNQTNISGTHITSKTLGDVRGKTSGTDSYNVTSWVKAHYKNSSTDYGIRLQPSTVKSYTNRVCYISSDYYGDTSLRPLITINYLDFVGVKGVREAESSTIKTYNCQSYAFWLTLANGVDVFPQFTSNDYTYCCGTTVANALARTKERMKSWLNTNFNGKWREVNAYNAKLNSNEWLICMRVGVGNGIYDYHFWYRASNGYWYNKHGYYAASEKVSESVVNPSTANSSDGWALDGTYFYKSSTVYYAIEK